MVRLWVKGAECTVPQDLEIEFTYNVTDADGLETQCSHYSTAFALPITEDNMAIFTPLFDIHTVYGSASFDIYSNAPAIIEIAGQSTRGYVKMESIDSQYHLRFIDGAGLLLDKLRSTNLSDLSLGNIPDVASCWSYANYDNQYLIDNQYAHFTFFPVFSEDEDKFNLYTYGDNGQGVPLQGQFTYNYNDNGTTKTGAYELTRTQARAYASSQLRCAVQVRWLLMQALGQAGFIFNYSTDFFQTTNPYWKNLFMVLKQVLGSPDAPATRDAGEWMPDMTCEDFVLGYAKMFGLRIVVEGTTVRFLKRWEYYRTAQLPEIGGGVDRKKGITVSPNTYRDTEVSCGLELCGGDDATYNRSASNAVNLYEGLPFKYADIMRYRGPVARWTEGTYFRSSIAQGQEDLPYLDSTNGGELLFRFNNETVEKRMLQEDDINSPSDNINVYAPFVVTSMPKVTPLNAAAPLYADRRVMRYNYDYHIWTSAQQFYKDFFKDYVDEIRSADNAILECEGYFEPGLLARMSDCRQVVMLDGVRCRVIECVTNGITKAKLKLQKITNISNLTAGQGFSGYFLQGTSPTPYVAIPSDSTVGTEFPLPLITNDTISNVVGYASYLSVSASGVKVTGTLPESTSTVGSITAKRPTFVFYDVTTAHGLTLRFAVIIYKVGNAIDYYPDEFTVVPGDGFVTFFPVVMSLGDNYELGIYNGSGQPYGGNSDWDVYVMPSGAITIRALNYNASDITIYVAAKSGGNFIAISIPIDFTITP